MNDSPLLLVVQHARKEAEQRRVMERALAEATPLEKAGIGAPSSPGDRARLRPTPVVTKACPGPCPAPTARDPPGEGIHA